MKKLRSPCLLIVIAITAIVLSTSNQASAQTKVFVGASTGYLKELGYNYEVGFSLGLNSISKSKKWEGELALSGGPSPKQETGDGYNLNLGGSLYWTPNISACYRLLLGASASAHRQITSAWQKTNIRASVIAGFGNDTFRLITRWTFPPIKLDIDPWIYGPNISESLQTKLSKHFETSVTVGIAPIRNDTSTIKRTCPYASVGLRYFF